MLRLADCSDWHRSCAMLWALASRVAANGDLTADANLIGLRVGQGCCAIISEYDHGRVIQWELPDLSPHRNIPANIDMLLDVHIDWAYGLTCS